MITKNYKTLRGMIEQTSYKLINFNDFKRGQFYHQNLGMMVKFVLPEEEYEKAYELFASRVYSRAKNKSWRLRNYHGNAHGILKRLWITTKRTDSVRADYCAGQDEESEMKVIQRIFSNGN